MDGGAAAQMPRQMASQVPASIMSDQAAAAAGITRITTPVSMSVLDLILLEHNCVRAMYDAYRAPSTGMESRQLLAWSMISALSAHAAKEELIIYPAIRSVLGDACASQLANEHQTVKNLLAVLDTMQANDPDFDMQLRASLDTMIAHMQEEEATVLPRMGAMLDAATQLELGIRFEAAKVRAPTRPHPEAGGLPAPFNETQLAAAKLVDASADQARMPALAPTAVALSPLASAALTASAASQPAQPGMTGGMAAPPGAGLPTSLAPPDGLALALPLPPTSATVEAAADAGLLSPAQLGGGTGAAAAPADDGLRDMALEPPEPGLQGPPGAVGGGGGGGDAMDAVVAGGAEPRAAADDDAAGAAGGTPGDLTAAGPASGGGKAPMVQDLAPSGVEAAVQL